MTLTLKQQVENLCQLQDTLNTNISGEDWRDSGNNYMLAASLECGEAIGHTDWAWWKAGKVDIPQIKLELVDILFFVLSQAMSDGFDLDNLVDVLEYDGSARENDILFDLRYLNKTLSVIYPDGDDIWDSFQMLLDCVYTIGMTFTDLYKLYIGKCVLNQFRQDHGYKDGTYIKDWYGQEDNEALFAIVDDLEEYESVGYTHTFIYIELKKQYPG